MEQPEYLPTASDTTETSFMTARVLAKTYNQAPSEHKSRVTTPTTSTVAMGLFTQSLISETLNITELVWAGDKGTINFACPQPHFLYAGLGANKQLVLYKCVLPQCQSLPNWTNTTTFLRTTNIRCNQNWSRWTDTCTVHEQCA